MNLRPLAVAVAIGAAACFLFIGLHGRGRRPVPALNYPAAAQAAESVIQLKALPRTLASDDGWNHFEITVPPSDPPLDMHVAFLVDGKGTDYITAQSPPWTQPALLKLRLDNDDDKRVKTILKAQGLPVNERLVTYHFAYQSSGGAAVDKTLKFLHSSAGPGGIEAAGQASARVGDKIMLYQAVVYDDSAIHSPLYRPSEDWHSDALAAKYPPGFLHRLTIYLQFQRHQGPPANGIVYNSKAI